MAKTILTTLIAASALCFVIAATRADSARVLREDDRVYIVDRRGERWDVTQAESIGFRPERFQYGIGRHAIPPLDDTRLTPSRGHTADHLRVIGIGENEEARAYSVRKLTRHEIVNATVGKDPVAVAY